MTFYPQTQILRYTFPFWKPSLFQSQALVQDSRATVPCLQQNQQSNFPQQHQLPLLVDQLQGSELWSSGFGILDTPAKNRSANVELSLADEVANCTSNDSSDDLWPFFLPMEDLRSSSSECELLQFIKQSQQNQEEQQSEPTIADSRISTRQPTKNDCDQLQTLSQFNQQQEQQQEDMENQFKQQQEQQQERQQEDTKNLFDQEQEQQHKNIENQINQVHQPLTEENIPQLQPQQQVFVASTPTTESITATTTMRNKSIAKTMFSTKPSTSKPTKEINRTVPYPKTTDIIKRNHKTSIEEVNDIKQQLREQKELIDPGYLIRRQKNNDSAKRCRDKKKLELDNTITSQLEQIKRLQLIKHQLENKIISQAEEEEKRRLRLEDVIASQADEIKELRMLNNR
eukprot:Awhi_evm1s12138